MTLLEPRTRGQDADRARWGPLYRVGAAAALLALAAYLLGIVLVTVQGGYPSEARALLVVVAEDPGWYAARQLIWLVPGLAMALASAALAVAHRRSSPVLAVVSGGIGISAWLLSLAWPTTGDGSLAVIWLADRFVTGGPEAQVPLVGAAELLIALNDAPNVLGVLQTVSILLLGVLLLRNRRAALGWLGVATGAVGVACEIARPWLGWGYATYGLLLLVWLGALASHLRGVPRDAATPTRPRGR